MRDSQETAWLRLCRWLFRQKQPSLHINDFVKDRIGEAERNTALTVICREGAMTGVILSCILPR